MADVQPWCGFGDMVEEGMLVPAVLVVVAVSTVVVAQGVILHLINMSDVQPSCGGDDVPCLVLAC